MAFSPKKFKFVSLISLAILSFISDPATARTVVSPNSSNSIKIISQSSIPAVADSSVKPEAKMVVQPSQAETGDVSNTAVMADKTTSGEQGCSGSTEACTTQKEPSAMERQELHETNAMPLPNVKELKTEETNNEETNNEETNNEETNKEETSPETEEKTKEESSGKAKSKICETKHCHKVAKSIKDALNTSVDPCENFYEYACGQWVKTHEIPKFHSQFSRISTVSKHNEDKLMKALNRTDDAENINIKKLKMFYQSCMNVDEIDKFGNKPLLDHIRGLGSWALDKDWDAKKWDFYETLSQMHHSYPAEVFFITDVHSDPTKRHNDSEFVMMIDQATMNLPQIVYFTSPKIVKMVRDYMVDILALAGYERDVAKGKVEELLKFEAKLAMYSVPKILKKYVQVKLSKLIKAVPGIPWMSHLKKVFAPKPITEDSKVIVLANDYLPKMTELIKSTNKSVLSDYMVWRVVKDVVPLLSKPFRDVHFTLKKKLLGAKHDKSRETKCFGYTNNILGPLVGALFIREAFSPQSKEKVEIMMRGIIKSFENGIDHREWIDNQTNKAVHEKADAVVYKVGYPEYLYDEKQFNERYGNLNVTDTSHWFKNVLETDKFASWQTYQKLDTTISKHHWITVPQLVNAFYVITKNEVVIPAGILQPPFFYDGEIPRSLSYGAIGHVLGHELTHGFDTTGRKYDKDGEEIEKRSCAWSKNATKIFHDKAQCLVDQFSKYKVLDKFHLSGLKTLGENIADGGGVKLAFKAYKQFIEDNGAEEILPLIDMPSEKLFFLGYAQKECVHTTPAAEFLAATEDVHPPSKYRVIGTLSNLKEFSEIYKCPVGSSMNPKKKCEVW